MIAAIAAKDAATAEPAPAGAALAQENGRVVAAQCHKKVNPTAKKRPELKDAVPPAGGGMVTHFRCKECEFTRLKPIFHKNWARHCHDHYKGGDVDAEDTTEDTNDDAGEKKDGGDDDGADQTDDGRRAAGGSRRAKEAPRTN